MTHKFDILSNILIRICCMTLAALALNACQFIEDNSDERSVQGKAVKGIISNGIVKAYDLNKPDVEIARTKTDNNGNFHFFFEDKEDFKVDSIKDIYVELSVNTETRMLCDLAEGCYERVSGSLIAFGEPLRLPSYFKLSGIGSVTSGIFPSVNLSPLSHLIISTAKSLDDKLSVQNIELASLWLQDALNLEFDPLYTHTTDLTNTNDIEGSKISELQQGILSATLYEQSATVEWSRFEQDITNLNIEQIALSASNLANQLAQQYTNAEDEQSYSNIMSVSQNTALLADNYSSADLTIHTQPNSSSVQESEAISLLVLASGEGNLNYQWYKDDQALENQTSSTLYINQSQIEDAGLYHVVVSDDLTTKSTLYALVSVTSKPTPASITKQPSPFSGNEGDTVVLSVEAEGQETLSYQWQKGGSIIPGATTSTLIIENALSSDSGSYRVTVSNDINTTNSEFVTVTINEQTYPPSISEHPLSLTVTEGQSAAFTVSASGTGFLSYQWYKDSSALSGEYQDNLTIDPVSMADGGSYHVVVSNGQGSYTSLAAELSVLSNTVPVTITQHPVSQELEAGQGFSLKIGVTGDGPITYKWYKDSILLTGASSDTLTIAEANIDDSGIYSATASNSANIETSNSALVTVVPYVAPIAITHHPVSQALFTGQDIRLSVSITGSGDINYQWYKDGSLLLGASEQHLIISDAELNDSGNYHVTISNSKNSVSSQTAEVNIVPEPVPVSITQQPSAQELFIGQTINLSVSVVGDNPITYQWYKDNQVLEGETSRSLSISGANFNDSGSYRVEVTNPHNSITSNNISVLVKQAPSIQLSWATPTQRNDGEELFENEIYRYVIEYGFTANSLESRVEINSQDANSYTIRNIGYSGTIYVRIATMDTDSQQGEFSQTTAISF